MTIHKNINLVDFSSGGGCGCKVPPKLLKKLLNKYKNSFVDKNLLVGNSGSDDAAVYKINNRQAIVATTDFFTPIVNNPKEFGKIAAANAISDIYAMGAKPIFALAILSIPSNKIPVKVVRKILSGGKQVCKSAGIEIVGGHTIESSELIYGLSVIGIVDKKKIITNSNAKHKDDIIITKPLGVGIISSTIKKNCVEKKQYKLLISNCTKLNNPGHILNNQGLINSMTDITGFGLIGHLKEMCQGSNKKAIINYNLIPKIEGVISLINKNFYTGASERNWLYVKDLIDIKSKLNNMIKIILSDPQTSGGLLISCKKTNTSKVLNFLKNNNFKESAVIGEFIEKKPTILIK